MTGAEALFARALALEDAGRSDEALQHYRTLLAQAPAHADAWHNHGLLLAKLGRLAEAEQSHRAYLRAHPQSARARCNLADVLLAFGRYDEVIETLNQLDEPTAVVRRGVALSCLRRFNEARATFSLACSSSPEQVAAFLSRIGPGADLDLMLSPENIFIERGYSATGQCDWKGWNAYVEEMRRAARDPAVALEAAAAFMALHVPLSGVERHAIARGVAARIEGKFPAMPPPGPRGRGRLRVGVLSPDFREHLNAYLLLPLFELADRGRFELYAYSLAPDDGSAIRSRVQSAADGFRDVRLLSDQAAARLIRDDDVDLLVDAGGYTSGCRFAITAQRPARVQANYLAFPGSLGSARVDYAIVDRAVATDEREWTESLVHLPATYYLYDFRQPVPDVTMSRADYGLPRDGFVYCAFHKAEKITPDAFDLWMEVLSRVQGSVLWFLALGPAAVTNLKAQAALRGIDPARVIFAPFDPRDRYLARQQLGDLVLDAVHHSAMTTACDAMAGGLPVLTLKGAAMASRAGESLARAAGLSELVAPNRDAFVRLAVQLAAEPTALAGYRDGLRRRKAPLFDTAARVRELEACFEEIVHNRLLVTEMRRTQ